MSRIVERIENFNRAYNLFVEAVEAFDKNKQLTHMALIQTFEVCYELAWKVLKDYLFLNGINVQFPREVIKEAFNKEALKNGQIWIDMLDARNITSHEYNMDKIDGLLIKITTAFYQEFKNFHSWINRRVGLPQRTIDELSAYFKAKPEIEKVLIFGSRAKGTFRNGSDIDLAIWAHNSDTFFSIAGELDNLSTPYKFDVIDYKNLSHQA